MPNICLSGGAKGADSAWGDVAHYYGHDVIHFSFVGHKAHVPQSTVVVLGEAELVRADPHLVIANQTMKRRWPIRNQHVANLLRRNFYQVVETESVYAVSTFEKRLVAGGTSWAVQMYLDRFEHSDPLPCYVFDQVRGYWTQWDGGGFEIIHQPPAPSGLWTGIGTRDLNALGEAAIADIWSPVPA